MHRIPMISDVARLARVSKTTVSRVINGAVHVSPESTQRVRAAIQGLGYCPNEITRTFRNQRSRTIGLIIPYLYDLPLANCAHAMATAARHYNCSFVLAVSNEDPRAEVIEAEQMFQRGVDGIAIISGRFCGRPIACDFAGEKPVVVFDRSLHRVLKDGGFVQNNSGDLSIAERLNRSKRHPLGLLRRSWRLYRIRGELQGYYMTIREGDGKCCSCMNCRFRRDSATSPFDLTTAESEHATVFFSNFEPTHLSLGELRPNELPIDHPGKCDPVQVSRTDSVGVCVHAQDVGQVAASLLLEHISP